MFQLLELENLESFIFYKFCSFSILKNHMGIGDILSIDIGIFSLVSMDIVGIVRGTSVCLFVNCIFLFNFTYVKTSPLINMIFKMSDNRPTRFSIVIF